ncbi:MAG: crossover junction endodeoxyribonuclease RuvC [Limnochordaceae bacterium]|nr:crossover junction endodeoxyribonuclease RuvC [Limnochordaceae bacterium]
MVVIGVDPGNALCGFGVVRYDGQQWEVVVAGAIRTPAAEAAPMRLLSIERALSDLIRTHHPEEMAVEKLYFNRNVRTAMRVGEARGVVLLTAARFGLPVAEYTPPAVKLAVTGNGAADKDQVGLMVQRILRLRDIPTPDDVADALAIAICHCQTATTRRRWEQALSGDQ